MGPASPSRVGMSLTLQEAKSFHNGPMVRRRFLLEDDLDSPGTERDGDHEGPRCFHRGIARRILSDTGDQSQQRKPATGEFQCLGPAGPPFRIGAAGASFRISPACAPFRVSPAEASCVGPGHGHGLLPAGPWHPVGCWRPPRQNERRRLASRDRQRHRHCLVGRRGHDNGPRRANREGNQRFRLS